MTYSIPIDAASTIHLGIGLRDYFAAQASDQDVLAVRQGYFDSNFRDENFQPLTQAQCRYMHADAMLAARSQS